MASRQGDSCLRLGVLVSGTGSNLQALIDAIESKELPGVEIALVVSNKADAQGLQRALQRKLNLPVTAVIRLAIARLAEAEQIEVPDEVE